MQRMKAFLLTTVTALWLALFAALPIAVQADGGDTTLIHACVAKDGTMRSVTATTACKSSETSLHWVNVPRVSAIETKNTTQDSSISAVQTTNNSQDSSISAIQTKNTQQDAAIAAASGGNNGLVVKDSLGQVIGKNINGTNFFRLVGNNPLQLTVGPQGFLLTGVSFLYTTTNCTGIPYQDDFLALGSLFNAVQTLDGQTGYYPDLVSQNLTIGSMGTLPDPIASCSNGFTPFTTPVAPVLTLDLSVFVPSFHLE
jgi:hypothetical protein